MPPITVIAVVVTAPAEWHTTEQTTMPATVPMAVIPVMHADRTTEDSTSSTWPQRTRHGLLLFLRSHRITALPPSHAISRGDGRFRLGRLFKAGREVDFTLS
jgi:hypothetical protein